MSQNYRLTKYTLLILYIPTSPPPLSCMSSHITLILMAQNKNQNMKWGGTVPHTKNEHVFALFNRPSGSWVIDQNNILHVQSITQEWLGPVEF